MSTGSNQKTKLPESNIQARSKISIVWLVPLIAMLIGTWLVYKSWSEKGQEIMITFKTAEGLEAGKTKIKYKNVVIGEVKTIHVNQQTRDIEVMAEMAKDFTPFLTNKTKFWVAKASVSASGVSGLGTLLSGAYIDSDPSKEGKRIRDYTGLEIPPVITSDTSGTRFILQTKNLGSIARDVPIFYKKFSVGRVEEVKMNDDGQSVSINIFIKSPFDKWVNHSTKFWNSSGVDVSMSADGVNLKTESLVSILIGGITFDSTSVGKDITPAANNTKFELYDTFDDSLKVDYSKGMKFVVYFTESVRGLSIGAPVEFRGIQLGEISDIKLLFDLEQKKTLLQVSIYINDSSVVFKGKDTDYLSPLNRKQRTDFLVEKGLRAQLETGNLLTGQLYIALDFFPDAEPFVINWDSDIQEFPSIKGTISIVKQNMTSILKKVDTMLTEITELSHKLNNKVEPKVTDTLQEVNKMIVEFKQLSTQLNHKLAPELVITLQQTTSTLAALEATLNKDSPLQQDIQITLRELSKAARSFKSLTDYLEKHPESLIKGKKGK